MDALFKLLIIITLCLGDFSQRDAFGKFTFNFRQHGLPRYAIIAKNFVFLAKFYKMDILN